MHSNILCKWLFLWYSNVRMPFSETNNFCCKSRKRNECVHTEVRPRSCVITVLTWSPSLFLSVGENKMNKHFGFQHNICWSNFLTLLCLIEVGKRRPQIQDKEWNLGEKNKIRCHVAFCSSEERPSLLAAFRSLIHFMQTLITNGAERIWAYLLLIFSHFYPKATGNWVCIPLSKSKKPFFFLNFQSRHLCPHFTVSHSSFGVLI